MEASAQVARPKAGYTAPAFTRRPLSEALGAEIQGVDLSQPLDPSTFAAVKEAWLAHNILLFRNQDVSEESQIRFASYFGPLTSSIFTTTGKTPSPIMLVSNIRKDGKPIGELPDGEMWFHSDQCYIEKPCAGTMLYAIEVPSRGGNTIFGNMYTAYETLPEAMKSRLTGLQAMNIYDYQVNSTSRTGQPGSEAPRYAHPVVRTHPETGRKALYVNRLMTAYIEGLPADESDSLLNHLFDHQEQRSFCYEHAWRKGDYLLWDNRCTTHARTDFPANERRLLRRIIVLGEKPV
ncbi:MAG TPA: TauD/TfdA family dioxygenase [Xanthobacteraceae bacterium]|jgi:taurine dioxygenase